MTPKGIRQTPTGWQVFARVQGRYLSRRFPPDTSMSVLVRERERLRAEVLFRAPKAVAPADSFAADAEAYLALVGHMPSYDDRAYEIRQWAIHLGARARADITPQTIRAILEQWRVSGKADGTGLSPSSLNKRRTALMHLYTTLNGKGGVNPVKAVPAYDESDSIQLRAHDPRVLYRIIARVARKRRHSKTRARLRLMLWTGWPQSTIMRLTEGDIDWQDQSAWIRGRKKGKGTRGRRVPLLPGAMIALKAFVAAKAWGDFSTSGMHKAFERALLAENQSRQRKQLPPLDARPYDLRHTFGTEIAKRLTDERAIQELMLHSHPSQTRRYTDAATADRLVQARDLLATLATSPIQNRRKQARTRTRRSTHSH